MNKLMYLWFAAKTVLCTCQPDHRVNDFKKVRSYYKISKIGRLPTVINESSGLAKSTKPDHFISHNDSGGKTELYEFDLSGKLTATKSVPNAVNADWEDMTRDEAGNYYIGDIGNNGVARDEFQIYQFADGQEDSKKITFKYASQRSPERVSGKPEFDSEAFFYFQKNLFLFSKNWGENKFVKLYSMPAQPGNHTLVPTDSIRIDTQVTAADISPDGKTFALLTYGKILLFGIKDNRIDFSNPLGCFRFVKKQTEALIFLNNTDMMVTNEQGEIYRITYQ